MVDPILVCSSIAVAFLLISASAGAVATRRNHETAVLANTKRLLCRIESIGNIKSGRKVAVDMSRHSSDRLPKG